MPLDSNEDKALALLMRQAQLGDKKAYNELLNRTATLLKWFFLKRLGSEEESEDLVQETLVSIHGSRHSYDAEKRFTPWMYTIARYRLVDYWRKQMKRLQNEVVDERDFKDKPEPLEKAPRVLSEKLDNALNTLSEKQRRVVVLLKVEGFSLLETARELNMTVAAIKVTAHRAYKALRKEFENGSYENE